MFEPYIILFFATCCFIYFFLKYDFNKKTNVVIKRVDPYVLVKPGDAKFDGITLFIFYRYALKTFNIKNIISIKRLKSTIYNYRVELKLEGGYIALFDTKIYEQKKLLKRIIEKLPCQIEVTKLEEALNNELSEINIIYKTKIRLT